MTEQSSEVRVIEKRHGLAGSPILAPAKRVLGDRLGTWTERGLDRIDLLFDRASRRNINGAVSERLAITLVQEAAMAENQVIIEYLAGVAAGANGDDAMPFLQIVRRLSTSQLRLHFLIYEGIRQAYMGKERINIFSAPENNKIGVWFPLQTLTDTDLAGSLHMLSTMQSEGLIGDYRADPEGSMQHNGRRFPAGLIAHPSTDGFLLFGLLAGLDLSEAPIALFPDQEVIDHLDITGAELPTGEVDELPLPDGVKRLDERFQKEGTS